MFKKDVPLLPELQAYVQELEQFPVLRHPLVYSVPYCAELADFCNQQLRAKQAAVAEALTEKAWGRYIGLHERPYRLNAFLTLADAMPDADYWTHLRSIWLDSENIREQPDQWLAALSANRSQKEQLMSPEDQAYLAQLPDSFTVFRGAGRIDPFPLSWTLNREKAQWFATRFRARGRVYEVTVSKAEVNACFRERGEDEIVLTNLAKARIRLSQLR